MTCILSSDLSNTAQTAVPVCEQLPRTLRTRTATYVLTHLLARTAHAVLYHGYDSRRPAEPLVLKRLDRSLRHARREAEAHRRVGRDVPRVAPLLDCVTTAAHLYLVMPFYRNGDLFDLIMQVHASAAAREDPALVEDWAADVFDQLLEGVRDMHARGVYHRDLKPENVMIDDEGLVRIADFGLATLDREDRARGYGSEFYMPPESFLTEDVACALPEPCPAKADVWALGVLLLNLLRGRNPWPRADARHDAAFADYLRAPSALRDAFGLSDEAYHLVSRMLCPCVETRASLDEVMELAAQVRRWLYRPEEDAEQLGQWEHVAAEAALHVTSDEEEEDAFGSDDEAMESYVDTCLSLAHDEEALSELASLREAISARPLTLDTALANAALLPPASLHDDDDDDEDDTMTLGTWPDPSDESLDAYGKQTAAYRQAYMEPVTPTSNAFSFASTGGLADLYPPPSAALLLLPDHDDELAAAWMLEHGGSGAGDSVHLVPTPVPTAASGKRIHSRRGSLAFLQDRAAEAARWAAMPPSHMRPATAFVPTTDAPFGPGELSWQMLAAAMASQPTSPLGGVEPPSWNPDYALSF